MHKSLLSISLVLVFVSSKAQTAETIIAELHSINNSVVKKSCVGNDAAAISNRAMNIFLADKTGYLSESTDLSLYTNYATLNTTDGKVTVNHNFQKATGIDEPIKKLFCAGISIGAANEITAPISDQKFENDLGLTLSYKWLGKIKTHFADCGNTTYTHTQKQSMDALRAALLHSLEVEINKKADEFKIAIGAIDTADIPEQNRDSAKAIMLRHFYKDLQAETNEKFAGQQAKILTETNNFKKITTSWTSLTFYIPIISPNYTVASSLTATFQKKHSYSLDIVLSHTRLWESTKAGRLFFTLAAKALLNNSKSAYLLNKISISEYHALGGTNTTYLAELRNGKAYIGQYENFITPSLKGRLVYFPPGASHVGISVALEQNFGKFNTLNGKVGIPVILINSKKLPAANFEFYVQFFDMNNRIKSANKYGSRTFAGLNIGIPFSRLMY